MKRLSLILIFLICTFNVYSSTLPKSFWQGAGDYTFMYYNEPLQASENFCMETPYFYMAFNYRSLKLVQLDRLKDMAYEQEALRKHIPLIGNEDLLEVVLKYNGCEYPLSKGCVKPADCQLIESGKFFQHRYLTNLHFSDGAPQMDVNLHVMAWADQLGFAVDVAQSQNLPEAWEIEIRIKKKAGFRYFSNDNKPRQEGGRFIVSGKKPVKLNGRNFYRVSALIRVEERAESLADVRSWNRNFTVKAEMLMPKLPKPAVPVLYDRLYDCYTFNLNHYIRDIHGAEKIRLKIENNGTSDRYLRLCFNKLRVGSITGISAILRDTEGNPTGIPVQISKNWHQSKDKFLYQGPWFRGFTTLYIPASQTIELELMIVSAFWGKLPAASHAQLCLVGWSGRDLNNQQWDQSAIGAFGESICYEPDCGLGKSFITDVRPLMVKENLSSPNWKWTGNVGGADFFHIENGGKRMYLKQIKTSYRSYGPNMTDLVYSAMLPGNEANVAINTRLSRSDDYVRGNFHVRMEVLKDFSFTRFVIFQLGSENYSVGSSNTYVIGNEKGKLHEWKRTKGERKKKFYVCDYQLEKNNVVWVSMHDSENKDRKFGVTANRGFVIRNWDATISGTKVNPRISEYAGFANLGRENSYLEINLPKDINSLKKGDVIEMDITMVVLPLSYANYYGPNPMFAQALAKDGNTWRMVYREATSTVEVTNTKGGKTVSLYPVTVRAEKGKKTNISFRGGIGYVPVVIEGLDDYSADGITFKNDNGSIDMDMQEYHGKDFWQTDYDPESKTWRRVYNVPMDEFINFAE